MIVNLTRRPLLVRAWRSYRGNRQVMRLGRLDAALATVCLLWLTRGLK